MKKYLFPRQQLIFAFLVFAFSYAFNTQAAEMRALIIGVSSYPTLPVAQQLQAPRNDAIRMREVLLRRGFKSQNISIVSDGISGAALPTHANILNAINVMAKETMQGDMVVLYFAGHGSLQPEVYKNAEGQLETRAMQPIFLPRDVGIWSAEKKSIINALLKSELRSGVDSILAKGAVVWGIFDACHSAKLVRGGGGSIRYRSVDPELLGVPTKSLIQGSEIIDPTIFNDPLGTSVAVLRGAAEPGAVAGNANSGSTYAVTRSEQKDIGSSVFFYATQTKESTPELTLPIGQPDGKPFGLFSYVLSQALDTGIPMTYRQLAQYILTRYGAMNETAVTPFFSGTDLDQPVLTQHAPLVQQWKLEASQHLSLNAGALSQLTVGSILAVVPNPLAQISQTIGYVKLVHVGLNSATAESLAYKGLPALPISSLPKESFARLIHVLPSYQLLVSIDARECGISRPQLKMITSLRGIKDSVAGTSITWLDAPAHGDVMLKFLPDKILLLPLSLQGGDCNVNKACAHAIEFKLNKNDLEKKAKFTNPAAIKEIHLVTRMLSSKLIESLHAIARANNLLKIAAQLSKATESISTIEVTTKIIPKNGLQHTYTIAQIPTLHSGDKLRVSLHNPSDKAVDATILYMDARFGVSIFYPEQAGAGNRLEAKATEEFEVEIGADTTGIERMLAISVEAMPNRERADFSFLAQPTLNDTLIRRDREDEDSDLIPFADAGFADYLTRGSEPLPKPPSSRTSIQVFTFNIKK